MKVLKFRIKNYKSIVDSGDCYMTDNVTILAGKNESGKTSILEALEDFDTDREIRQAAVPIAAPKEKPLISISFSIDETEISEVCEVLGLEDIPKLKVIEILKEFPKKYSYGAKTIGELDDADWNSKKKILAEVCASCKSISDFLSGHPTVSNAKLFGNAGSLQEDKGKIAALRAFMASNPGVVPIPEERNQFLTMLQDAASKIAEYEGKLVNEKEFLTKILTTRVPNFILFNSFDDVFPNKVPLSSLETNTWIKDLQIISDLDVPVIKSGLDRDRRKHKTALNIKINAHYKKFWTQGESNLSIDWDSQNLLFYIEEDGQPYEPNLRSKGRQWHLAFYIKITARAKENVANIILIDEPGLFLHASAQADILQNLEESAKETQIVFSTHSPYLLEADKLNRIRLVFKGEYGTKIENKVHAVSDKETLTPILTAIGCNIPKGIDNLEKKNNLVVEGISDVYYLEAFKRLFSHSGVNVIFGGGANMATIGTILNGWGCKVKYLYDNDQGKKDAEKNLAKNWCINKDDLFSVLESEGTIEDVFSVEDFKKCVLENETVIIDGKNSDYLKKSKKEKALLAKNFLESVEQGRVALSKKTEVNVKKIFASIASHFK